MGLKKNVLEAKNSMSSQVGSQLIESKYLLQKKLKKMSILLDRVWGTLAIRKRTAHLIVVKKRARSIAESVPKKIHFALTKH